jgi:ribonuclease J
VDPKRRADLKQLEEKFMNHVRIYALGGLDEDGKNLSVVEFNQQIFILDVGLKYPDRDRLGVEVIIPDFKPLMKHPERVKAIFITHGHDDVMSALPYLIRELNVPIYTTPLTAKLIEGLFRENGIQNYSLKVIQRDDRFSIDGVDVRTFPLTHSIADTFGVSILSPFGQIVYAAEFIIDFNARNEAFSCDVTKLADIGKDGVFALLTESVYADRPGYTAPNHSISEYVESVMEGAKGRLLVSMYEQNLYRLIELLELARKFKRKVYFFNKKQRELLRLAEELGYYKLAPDLELSPAKFNNDLDDVMIIVSGSGPRVFNLMHKIAMKEDERIELRSSDTVIIASPIVPGTEREASRMENELYKEDVSVSTLDRRHVISMHASTEDIKMMLYMLKPKYFLPIHGEYRHLINNANIALDLGYYADKIVVLDNGQIAHFENAKLVSTSDILKLDEVLIDGNAHLDTTGYVLRDRELLSTDGVLVVGIVVNFNTKEVIGGPDVQSRGLIYLKDAEHIVKEVGNIFENTVNSLVSAKRYDNMGARSEARDKIAKYIFKATGKKPMILPVIIEINASEHGQKK